MADAAIALHREHALFRGLARLDKRVVRQGAASERSTLFASRSQQKRKPATSYDAQFSMPYIVATALLKGRFTLDELEPAALADPAVLALAARVEYEIDPDSTFPRHYTGEVIVERSDGTRVAHREAINRGCADRPVSNDDIVAKFYANAQRTVSRSAPNRSLRPYCNSRTPGARDSPTRSPEPRIFKDVIMTATELDTLDNDQLILDCWTAS